MGRGIMAGGGGPESVIRRAFPCQCRLGSLTLGCPARRPRRDAAGPTGNGQAADSDAEDEVKPGGGTGRTLVVLLGTLLGTSGCAEMEIAAEMLKSTSRPAASQTAPTPVRLSQSAARETPAPEIFADRISARWNGQETIGGVWIAHPDAGDPARVAMTDTRSGRSVTGAMFRRRAASPAGGAQLSSAAARALGLPPDQPALLDIVALRREALPATVIARAPRMTDTSRAPRMTDASHGAHVPDAAGNPRVTGPARMTDAEHAPRMADPGRAAPTADPGRAAPTSDPARAGHLDGPGPREGTLLTATAGPLPGAAGTGRGGVAPLRRPPRATDGQAAPRRTDGERMPRRPEPAPRLAVGDAPPVLPRPRPARLEAPASDASGGIVPRPRPARGAASETPLTPAFSQGDTLARVG
ncbi:hypothetical protein FDP22_02475 [Paroceanicella profunda]|uniref:Uncharacterized protein n=1 Tax=Paroceanicella profunda TaxID=2579971 RepID=A0A5B8FG40_9RHOB|nr:hypothetical protein [Paroceanicella profunda]QDL90751.1 hypothetical protein FDP22_02475 [Paroceanicella profunda]